MSSGPEQPKNPEQPFETVEFIIGSGLDGGYEFGNFTNSPDGDLARAEHLAEAFRSIDVDGIAATPEQQEALNEIKAAGEDLIKVFEARGESSRNNETLRNEAETAAGRILDAQEKIAGQEAGAPWQKVHATMIGALRAVSATLAKDIEAHARDELPELRAQLGETLHAGIDSAITGPFAEKLKQCITDACSSGNLPSDTDRAELLQAAKEADGDVSDGPAAQLTIETLRELDENISGQPAELKKKAEPALSVLKQIADLPYEIDPETAATSSDPGADADRTGADLVEELKSLNLVGLQKKFEQLSPDADANVHFKNAVEAMEKASNVLLTKPDALDEAKQHRQEALEAAEKALEAVRAAGGPNVPELEKVVTHFQSQLEEQVGAGIAAREVDPALGGVDPDAARKLSDALKGLDPDLKRHLQDAMQPLLDIIKKQQEQLDELKSIIGGGSGTAPEPGAEADATPDAEAERAKLAKDAREYLARNKVVPEKTHRERSGADEAPADIAFRGAGGAPRELDIGKYHVKAELIESLRIDGGHDYCVTLRPLNGRTPPAEISFVLATAEQIEQIDREADAFRDALQNAPEGVSLTDADLKAARERWKEEKLGKIDEVLQSAVGKLRTKDDLFDKTSSRQAELNTDSKAFKVLRAASREFSTEVGEDRATIARLKNVRMGPGTDFSYVSFRDAQIENVRAYKTEFISADFRDVRAKNFEMQNCYAPNFNASGARFMGRSKLNGNVFQRGSFHGAQLGSVEFHDNDARQVDFKNLQADGLDRAVRRGESWFGSRAVQYLWNAATARQVGFAGRRGGQFHGTVWTIGTFDEKYHKAAEKASKPDESTTPAFRSVDDSVNHLLRSDIATADGPYRIGGVTGRQIWIGQHLSDPNNPDSAEVGRYILGANGKPKLASMVMSYVDGGQGDMARVYPVYYDEIGKRWEVDSESWLGDRAGKEMHIRDAEDLAYGFGLRGQYDRTEYANAQHAAAGGVV